MQKIHPLIITDKLSETVSFYKKYFAFEEIFTSDWYVQLAHENGVELAFMLPNQASQPDFLREKFSGAGYVLTIETDDARELHENLHKIDAPIIQKIRDEEWGQRHFLLRDPSGSYVDVVEYL